MMPALDALLDFLWYVLVAGCALVPIIVAMDIERRDR